MQATTTLAQDADLDPTEPKKTEAAPEKKAPEKKDANKADVAKDAKGPAKAEPKPDNPLVVSIRESNPTTPRELLRAVQLTLDLEALPAAEEYFKKLSAAPLTDAQRLELAREFDPGLLFRIANTKSFGPEGRRFAQAIFEAQRKVVEDPARMAKLIDGLASPNDATRAAARTDLLGSGRVAIGPLVRVLADPQKKNSHAEARAVLVAMGRPAVEPLIAVLIGSGPALRAQAAAVLAQSDDPRAADALLADSVAPGASPEVRQLAQAAVQRTFNKAPTQVEVAARLMRQIEAYLRDERGLSIDENGQAEVWLFNRQTNDLHPQQFAPPVAAAYHAVNLASRLKEVAAGSPTAEQWLQMAYLQLGRLSGMGIRGRMKEGPGKVLYEQALKQGPAVIEPVLRMALDKGHLPAALGALEVLGETRHSALLSPRETEPSALMKAAVHGDPRIRLAAFEAIAALRPKQAVAGLSVVSNGLMELASVTGERRAVVADPRADRAHALASLLAQCGLTAAVTTTGRDAFREAAASTEVELILIVMTVENPDAKELLRQLRRDPRTARLPVGLIADPDRLYRAEGIALGDPLVAAFVRPRDEATMRERVQTLEGLLGTTHVPHVERREQAARALAVIAALTEKPQRLYDFQGLDAAVEPALYVADLAPKAIDVLARCRTQRAQKALVDLASAGAQPLETRKAAAAGFAESVKRHGILLSTAQIMALAKLYDHSDALDQASQDVLWSLLETMQTVKKKTKPMTAN